MTYRPRVVDGELKARLRATGAVVIEGPRACGKTETARQAAASEVLLDVDSTARAAMAIDPSLVLAGPVPRLIDEWQLEPAIWNHVRRAVDDRRQPGQFILTGSATPADDAIRHTGAGRISRLRMRPRTLFELGHSNGAISLRGLLSGERVQTVDPGITVTDIAERVSAGGWPGLLDLPAEQAVTAVRGYLEETARADLERADGVRRDPTRVLRVLRALARNTATYATLTTIAADAGGIGETITDDTVGEYVRVLERLMIVEDQPPWAPSLRSRSRLRSAAKRHFVDPSLAVAALAASPEHLLRDLNLLGNLFESLVVRDLRVHGEAMGARILQYRDNTGAEADAIIETADGGWAAFEIKLGPGQVDAAAASLLRMTERIDTNAVGTPLALGVIVGFGYGLVRPDGVAVIPIGALRP